MPGEGENKTAFFEYNDLTPEEIETHNGYIKEGQISKKWYAEKKAEVDSKEKTHCVNNPGEGFRIDIKEEPIFKFTPIRSQTYISKL
mmetsp:Transcript_5137/g.4721  ORF Transcript_5137/g.4721 Transcript_5137/m.4721 type:complete len:87 (-) Transcript_5137:36-296(-)